MGWFTKLWNTVGRRAELPEELDEEMRFHLEERTRDYVAEGMSPAEARRRAAAKFGGAARLLEETRDADVLVTLDVWLRDAAIALRGLLRRPGLALAVTLSLALGVGLNSAVFSVVDTVLLRPLAFPGAAEVWTLRESLDGNPVGGNPARFRDWRDRASTLAVLAGFYGEGLVMTGRGDAERIRVGRTFGAPLRLLNAEPALGRGFTAAEERGEGGPVLVLMHRFWQKRFGGDPAIVGQSVTLGKQAFAVIGVLPAGVGYPEDTDAIAPAEPGFQRGGRDGNWFGLAARLAPGVTREAAEAQLRMLAGQMAEANPATDRRLAVRLEPLGAADSASARQPLLLLMGVVAFVLLIACLNIASLLVARAAERTRETAVRASLGAGRLSLMRLFLLESLWLAAGGGFLALGVAYWGVEALRRVLPSGLPRLEAIALDERVLWFTAAATVASALVFGLLPAIQATGRVPGTLMREGRGTVSPRARQGTRRILVALQSALSVMLLVGATLAAQGFVAMRERPLGFEPGDRLAVALHLPWGTPPAALRQFTAKVLEEFARIPGVARVGLTDRLPLEGETQSGPVAIQGVTIAEALRRAPVDDRTVSAGYFQAVGQPLLRGRLFEDREDGPDYGVVNQAFVDRYLTGAGDPVGKLVTFDTRLRPGETPRYIQIAGVVGNVRRSPSEPAAVPAVYHSYRHGYWPMNEFVLATASGVPAGAIAGAVREAVRRVDPHFPITALRSLDSRVEAATAGARVQAVLLGAFAVGALFLAAVGLYGLLASDVAQRTQEIGVRLALGATSGELVALIVRQGAQVTSLGLAAGLAGAVVLARTLGGAVAGIPSLDWRAPAAAAIALMGASTLASLLPARRAAAIDPAEALRRE